MSGIWNYSGMLAKEYMACMTAVTGLWLNVIYSVALGSPIIDGIFLVHKMCIYSSIMIITTVLITHGPAQWWGQLVMHHDVNMMHHKLTMPLNCTACNQYSCNNHYRRINTHFLNQKYTINYWATYRLWQAIYLNVNHI